jgi:hypothetical protein
VIDGAGKLGGFAVQRVARQADDAKQARQALARALLRPVEGRALRVGVDEGDAASAHGQLAGEM